MLAVGALACTYSLMRSYGGIALIAFLIEFLSTPVYPCHVQLIRGWMPVEEAARGFWLLGLSSRTGDVLSKLGYGSLLAIMSWQQLTWCAAGIALGAALLGGLRHRDSPSARDRADPPPSPSPSTLTLHPHPHPHPHPPPSPSPSLSPAVAAGLILDLLALDREVRGGPEP